MNKPLLVAALAILLFHVDPGFSQTIRRVNNNPGITGVNIYTTIQDAHDAAAADDIIIVEPSTVSYGNLTATKRLKYFGNGYFLDVNTELNVNPSPSTLGYIYLHPGSDSSEFSGLTTSSITVYGVSKLKFRRNNLGYLDVYGYTSGYVASNVNGIEVIQNYASNISLNSSSSYGSISNTIISNNIIYYNLYATDQFKITNLIVRNNTFTNGSINIANAVFENNIYLPNYALTTYNTTVSYNVATGTLPAGTGNQSNVTMTNEFLVASTEYYPPAGVSNDERWKVNDGSILKTAGNGGIEVGAYGDANPYIISGIPARPTILKMVNSGSGSGAAPLDVTISIKSNN